MPQTADDRATSNAAYSVDGGESWQAVKTRHDGFRSAPAYNVQQKLWLTVGLNGTDISCDDGRNWIPLKPSPQDPPDSDKHWNALSLPFVVGSLGRIGKLNLKPPTP